jgi:hypothetical protein
MLLAVAFEDQRGWVIEARLALYAYYLNRCRSSFRRQSNQVPTAIPLDRQQVGPGRQSLSRVADLVKQGEAAQVVACCGLFGGESVEVIGNYLGLGLAGERLQHPQDQYHADRNEHPKFHCISPNSSHMRLSLLENYSGKATRELKNICRPGKKTASLRLTNKVEICWKSIWKKICVMRGNGEGFAGSLA